MVFHFSRANWTIWTICFWNDKNSIYNSWIFCLRGSKSWPKLSNIFQKWSLCPHSAYALSGLVLTTSDLLVGFLWLAPARFRNPKHRLTGGLNTCKQHQATGLNGRRNRCASASCFLLTVLFTVMEILSVHKLDGCETYNITLSWPWSM